MPPATHVAGGERNVASCGASAGACVSGRQPCVGHVSVSVIVCVCECVLDWCASVESLHAVVVSES